MGFPDLTPLWIFLFVSVVVATVPSLVFGFVVNRFINILDRKWQREAERDTIRAEADRLNRPFTNR
ncbi:MAG TPA: hypothetical protein VI282_12185 [Verrucomicrobiae bacterium]|jgi:hypothetical protein